KDIFGYMRREDLLIELSQDENTSTNFFKIMLASIPMGLFVVEKGRGFVNCNETGLKMIRSSYDVVMKTDPGQIFNEDLIDKVLTTGETILNQIYITDDFGILADYSPIVDEFNNVTSVMIIVQDLPKIEEMAMEIEYVKDLNADLNAILSTMYDEILVVNNEGEILRHSENILIDSWEVAKDNLIGENILKLEKEGVLSKSVTKEVLNKKK